MKVRFVIEAVVPDDVDVARLKVGNLFLWERSEDGRRFRPIPDDGGDVQAVIVGTGQVVS